MKHLFLLLALSLSPSFSAISLFQPRDSPDLELPAIEENDPSRFAVEDFNKGNYLEAILRAQSLAETGNPTALLLMGLAYEHGKGINQSSELALEHYRKARKAGNKEAPYRLAHLLATVGGADRQQEARSILEALHKEDRGVAARLLGQGILEGRFGEEPDFDETRIWWEKAVDKGDQPAILTLAHLLDGDLGFPEKRDPAGALKLYLKAADLGDGRAMAIAGSRLLNGGEDIRDEKKGKELLAKAITNKQLDAYLVLGDYEENVTKDDSAAFAQYLKGAEAGQGQCMLKVASFILEGRADQEKNPKEALAWFKKAGEAGQVLGHVQAAKILLNGEGLQIVEGYTHLVAAAESGLVDMQNELGLLYLSGRLGVRDLTAAASWFQRSAAGKYPAGAFNLATLYEQGMGVPQSFDQAGRLYTLAANAGHPQSTSALGRLHAEGRGTKQNLPEAWALFSLALERGDQDAKDFIDQVAKLLKEDQLKKAREILAEYQKTPPAKGE
ncbi:MAG: SEL1-like repeat protein [Verrucomicrobiaceae bacterium]